MNQRVEGEGLIPLNFEELSLQAFEPKLFNLT
jgi:hypothetical protein